MKSSLNAISELPSFPLVSDHSCLIGNVTIHPQAAIAAGVVIQAAEDSQVIIEAGACIGVGVVIKAYHGTIVIEQGAVLGARVLIIGQGRIGNHACVGAATTIFNSSVESMLVINAYSVLGDFSRFVDLEIVENSSINEQVNPSISTEINEEIKDPWDDQSSDQLNQNFVEPLNGQTESEKLGETLSTLEQENLIVQLEETQEVLSETFTSVVDEVEPQLINISESLTENSSENLETEINPESPKAPVVGKVYINNLLLTLFPHRQVN